MIAATDPACAHDELDRVGYVVLEGIKPDKLPALLERFGSNLPYEGEWKYDVRVSAEVATMYTARSFGALHPHLDKYEWAAPPDLVALYGRQADSGGLGRTHLCNMTPFLDGLDDRDRHRLSDVPMTFLADEGLRAVGIDHQHTAPSLDLSDPAEPIFRYSYFYGDFPPDDPGFPALWDRVREWFDEHKQSILLTEDTLLIWRNKVILHGRESFTDVDRHLWRVYLRDA